MFVAFLFPEKPGFDGAQSLEKSCVTRHEEHNVLKKNPV